MHRLTTILFTPYALFRLDNQQKERKELLTHGLDKGVEFFRVTAHGGVQGNVGGADQIHNENDAYVLRIVKGTMDFGIVKANGPVVGFDASIDPRATQTGV
eukprot:scaffold64586_cov50-Attheya_sp.AAC.6